MCGWASRSDQNISSLIMWNGERGFNDELITTYPFSLIWEETPFFFTSYREISETGRPIKNILESSVVKNNRII